MAAHNDLGRWGEDIAAQYLTHQGYAVLYRDWKWGHRDLDIIALKDDTLVFVEVKTRRNELFANADTAVDARKVRSLSIAANAFLKQHYGSFDVRFDIISIIGTPTSGHTLRHTPNAFLPYI